MIDRTKLYELRQPRPQASYRLAQDAGLSERWMPKMDPPDNSCFRGAGSVGFMKSLTPLHFYHTKRYNEQ